MAGFSPARPVNSTNLPPTPALLEDMMNHRTQANATTETPTMGPNRFPFTENVPDILTRTVKKYRSYTELIGPAQAGNYLSRNKYSRQRPLDKKKVDKYAELMVAGKFLPGQDISFGVLDGHAYLLNGQHRLHAICKSGESLWFEVKMYPARDERHLAEMYAVFDTRGTARTLAEVLIAFGVDASLGVGKDALTRITAALRLIESDFNQITHRAQNLTDEELVDLSSFYADAIGKFYNATRHPAPLLKRPLLRASVISLGIVTFHQAAEEYGEDIVGNFWKGLAGNEGLYKGDPRRTAYDHLTTTQIETAQAVKDKKMVSAQFQSRYLANCWNAYIENRNITSAKPNVNAPIRILGTMWHG